jgi:predicted nucleotidyltransferase
MKVPEPYRTVINKIKTLETRERYLGAFVFGSVARGDTTRESDLDVKIIVTGKTHQSLNHPVINGVKLDISFHTMAQLIADTASDIKKHKRIPMIAESIIIFDKTEELTKLKKNIQRSKPRKLTKAELLMVEYFIYNEDSKVKRFLRSDPAISLLTMHMGLQFLLELHYQIHRKWYVSSKRLLGDLEKWDEQLSILVKDFIYATDIDEKYTRWSKIVGYIQKPFASRKPIEDNRCHCRLCTKDINTLLSSNII